MSDKQIAPAPLYDLAKLVAVVDEWAKRHRVTRLAANDVGIALEKVCDSYEAERRQSHATIATQAARIAEMQSMLDLYEADADNMLSRTVTQAAQLEAQAGLMALVEMDNARLVKWNAELLDVLRERQSCVICGGTGTRWTLIGEEAEPEPCDCWIRTNEIVGQDDWGKTVDYLISLAPEPEPPLPEPPDDWDEDNDEDKPHFDTPGGF